MVLHPIMIKPMAQHICRKAHHGRRTGSHQPIAVAHCGELIDNILSLTALAQVATALSFRAINCNAEICSASPICLFGSDKLSLLSMSTRKCLWVCHLHTCHCCSDQDISASHWYQWNKQRTQNGPLGNTRSNWVNWRKLGFVTYLLRPSR